MSFLDKAQPTESLKTNNTGLSFASKIQQNEQIQPQEPEKKGIFGRLMDIPSKLKSEVETQSQSRADKFKEVTEASKQGQDFGSTFLQRTGNVVGAGIIDPFVSIAKTGASLLTGGQKERGAKMVKDVAEPFVWGIDKAADKISDIPAVQKFAQTPEAGTLERNLEAVMNLTAILPVGEAKPLIKASGLGKAGEVIHDVAWKVSDDVSDLSKTIFTKSESQLEKSILGKFEKGVKPLIPGKTTPTQVTKYKTSVVDAVKTINENKGGLKYLQDTGEIISGKAPASLQQFSDSVEQTKKVIFKQYDALAQQSGKAGNVIDLTKVAKELDSVINSPSLAISNPQAITYAQNAQNNLLKFGSIDTSTTQDVVQQFNAKLSAFYRNPTPDGAGNSVIDAMIANSLRQEADTFITGLTGTEYSALKGKYGSLKAIEKDVIKANLRNARKNTKGLIDFTDIFTGADVVTGMLTMNPVTLARGGVMRGLKEYYKYINDPNNIIKKMFQDMDMLDKFKTAPSSKPKGLGDLGLSIKDVSGEANQSFLGKPKSSLQNTPQSKTPIPAKKVIPNTTTKTSTKSSLLEEAKKYKSADEFVEGQQKVFHATKGNFDTFDNSKLGSVTGARNTKLGHFFSLDKSTSEMFKGNLDRVKVDSTGFNVKEFYIDKILPKGGKVIDIHNTGNISIQELEDIFKATGGNLRNLPRGMDGINEIKRMIINKEISLKNNPAAIRESLIQKGYIGIKSNDFGGGIPEIIIFDAKDIKTKSQLTDIYNKAQGTKTTSLQQEAKKLDNLNPTGSLYVDYTPKARMELELGQNMTTLDKTMGKSANETITIYRGAPVSQKSIVGGDFITTNSDLAKSYAGEGNILSKEVKLSDILDDIESPLGEEYLYRPNASKELQNVKYDYTKSDWYKNYTKYFIENKDKFKTLDDWLNSNKASGKTKSQLKDIYNKAKGIVKELKTPKGLPELPKIKTAKVTPKKVKEFVGEKPAPFIRKRETTLLKERIKQQDVVGKTKLKGEIKLTQAQEFATVKLEKTIRQAELKSLKENIKTRATKDKIITNIKDRAVNIENIKKEIYQFAKEKLPLETRGKLLAKVSSAKTRGDLAGAFRTVAIERNKIVRKELTGNLEKTVKDIEKLPLKWQDKIMAEMDNIAFKGISSETVEKLNKLKNFLEQQPEAKLLFGRKSLKKSEAIKKLDKKTISDIKIQDLIKLNTKISRLVEEGKLVKKTTTGIKELKKEALLKNLQKTSKNIDVEIPRTIGVKLSPKEKLTNNKYQIAKQIQDGYMNYVSADIGFEILDNNVRNGLNMRTFKIPFDDAFLNYKEMNSGIVDNYFNVKKSIEKRHNITLEKHNMENIMVYATKMQEGGIEKLTNSGIYDLLPKGTKLETFVLNKPEEEMYQFMRNVFDELHPHIDNTLQIAHNKKLGKVDNYFSWQTDFNNSDEVFKRLENDYILSSRTAQGFTKERTLGGQVLKLNAEEVFLKHTNDATYFINTEELLNNLGGLARTNEYLNSVGKSGREWVSGWIDLMARKGIPEGYKPTWVTPLLNNVGAGILGFRLSPIVKQPLAKVTSSALLGKHTFKYDKQFFSQNLSPYIKILANSKSLGHLTTQHILNWQKIRS